MVFCPYLGYWLAVWMRRRHDTTVNGTTPCCEIICWLKGPSTAGDNFRSIGLLHKYGCEGHAVFHFIPFCCKQSAQSTELSECYLLKYAEHQSMDMMAYQSRHSKLLESHEYNITTIACKCMPCASDHSREKHNTCTQSHIQYVACNTLKHRVWKFTSVALQVILKRPPAILSEITHILLVHY